MNNKHSKRGFTLIELLVVVLIIGILSAVALPQYQKAVEKARISEALTNMSSLSKAVDLYVLAHGDCEGELLGSYEEGGATGLLDIDLESGLDCTVEGGDYCASKHFTYDSYGSSDSCIITAKRTLSDANNHEDHEDYYALALERALPSGQWEWGCRIYNKSDLGKKVCNDLYSKGWVEW